MPDAEQFLRGFGLIEGKTISGYTLTSAKSTHTPIKHYQEYRYSIKLQFNPGSSANYNSFYNKLRYLTNKKHTLLGIRNYYDSTIDSLKKEDIEKTNTGVLNVKLTGHAHRVK